MRDLEINDKLFLIPSKWQECTTEQVVELLPLTLFGLEGLGISKKIAVQKRALKVLLPIDINGLFSKMNLVQARSVIGLTDWIFTEKIRHKPFNFFELEGVKYYLPEENYGNTTAIEVALTNIYLVQYTNQEAPRPEAIFDILGTICRPKRRDLEAFKKSNDWTGDIREEYNSVLSEERAKKFTKLKFGYVLAIFQYFIWMNEMFLQGYKDVYEADQDEQPLYKNGEGILSCLFDVAKLNIFKGLDDVYKQNAHTVWMFLRDHSIKIKREIARIEAEQET